MSVNLSAVLSAEATRHVPLPSLPSLPLTSSVKGSAGVLVNIAAVATSEYPHAC